MIYIFKVIVKAGLKFFKNVQSKFKKNPICSLTKANTVHLQKRGKRKKKNHQNNLELLKITVYNVCTIAFFSSTMIVCHLMTNKKKKPTKWF